MKLRCTGNSIRIRVRKSELTALSEKGQVSETIGISKEIVFEFSLRQEKVERVIATLENNILSVIIPENIAAQWISSNQVGIEVQEKIADDRHLHILIEKDFPCLDREEEDYEDTFHELAEQKSKDSC